MKSGTTPPRKHPPKSTTMETFLSFSYRSSAQVKAEDEAQLGYLSSPSTSTQKAKTRPCEELIKDEAKFAEAIGRYLARYWSVGTLRLTLDILSPCIEPSNALDAYYRFVKPILVKLSKAGRVELVEDQVVNLVRGGEDGR